MIDVNDLDLYGAKLLSYLVSPSPVVNQYMDGYRSLLSRVQDTDVQKREIGLTVHICGQNAQEVVQRENALTAALHRDPEIRLPDEYIYDCIYTEGESTIISDCITEVIYHFVGVRREAIQSIPCLEATNMITCRSTVKSPCIIRISPKNGAVEHVSIASITVKNITSEVVIDGIKKTVVMDGSNKFVDTDLVEFPTLQPGGNTITVSDPTAVDVTVQYYPVYV